MKTPSRIKLAQLPTPIHKLERISNEWGKNVYVWRDDLTGTLESGNKARKLEYLLAQAVQQGCTRVITAGGVQSNHARATAVLARRLGLEISVVVRMPADETGSTHQARGNHFWVQFLGAEIHRIEEDVFQSAGGDYSHFLDEIFELHRRRGGKPCVIPEGGSNPLGCFGYIRAARELKQTWSALETGSEAPDSLFLALGSGGTLAGLCLGYALEGLSAQSIWAVNVRESEAYFQKRVGQLMADAINEFQLDAAPESLNILDGHAGAGYGVYSDEDLLFYANVARKEGVILDPIYTGKAFQGMAREIKACPDRFGNNILFLHTGGLMTTDTCQERYREILEFN